MNDFNKIGERQVKNRNQNKLKIKLRIKESMQFDFQQMKPSTNIKQSKNFEQILFQLDKRSDASGKHQEQDINFSNFGPIEQNKSVDKSLTSQLFNRPKEQSIPQSNQRPQFEFEEGSSRDIAQISYLYSQNESFRFDRSMSFEQQNKDNSRFQRLKGLLSKAKSNNLDAFYRNLQQATNQKNQGNIVFQNKNQFKQFTRNMRVQKREQEVKFQAIMEEKKANQKAKTKDVKVNLFGEQAFKKKQPSGNDFFLPPQYSQENGDDEFEVDFFGSGNHQQTNKNQPQEQDEYVKQKKQAYAKQAQQFFDFDGNRKQANNNLSGKPRSNQAIKQPLQPIREQKITLLDTSVQQKKFQQLILNYNSMKGNYNNLMQELKHTSHSQYQLMQEMQRIKHDYNTHQLKHSRTNSSQDKRQQQKRQEKDKLKQVKEQQLAQIKNEIYQIKATSTQKDLAYIKINEKIQQLEKLVRVALQEVQQEKIQHNGFTPKVINYYGDDYQQEQQSPNKKSQNKQDRQEFSDHANLSQQASSMYEPEINNLPSQQKLSSTGGMKKQKQYQSVPRTGKPSSKHHSKHPSNMQSYQASVRRQFQQNQMSYIERNAQQQPLNFIDQFSSPLQLDLSMGIDNQNNMSSESDQSYDIAFNPPDGSLQYLPLQLDQTQTKNLRNILTQKSSILFESFQFLITVRYTMQQDELYPVIGSLRVANKCAIDLLDVFVIVYGPQGQNVQVTPNKIFQQRLKYNTNIFFEVKLDKMCIRDNGFNVQICYKTDSITKKKINFKALLPMVQLIRPQFCYEQNFLDTWDSFRNEIYLRPKKLNFKHIRNHQDLKLVLPFIHISQQDPNTFSYGLMFRYPKSETMFMLKIACYINGKASVHLRSDKNGDQQLKEELLNVINFLFLK